MKKRHVAFILLGMLLLFGCEKKEDEKVIDLDEVSFKLRVEDTFGLVVDIDGVVIVGKIEEGTLNSEDIVTVVDADGNIKSENEIIGIEVYKNMANSATEGDSVGIDRWADKR